MIFYCFAAMFSVFLLLSKLKYVTDILALVQHTTCLLVLTVFVLLLVLKHTVLTKIIQLELIKPIKGLIQFLYEAMAAYIPIEIVRGLVWCVCVCLCVAWLQ